MNYPSTGPTLTDRGAALYIGMSESWLRQSRVTGNSCAPPYIKIGRAVRYLREDLDLWLRSKRQISTIQSVKIVNGVSYGDETRFTVQQWISPQDVAQIRAEDGKHIRIQMVVLDIRAVATDPTTAEIVEEFRVFLPSELQFAKDNWHLSPAFYAQANR